MGVLIVNNHRDRSFRDEPWDHGAYPTAYGYRSIGSSAEQLPRYGELWAFAVPENEIGGPLEQQLFDDIISLKLPFVVAEICALHDGSRCAIGFYPEPSDEA